MRLQCAERRRTRGQLGDGVWHLGAADWQAGCRRADSQIEHEHCARWHAAWKLKRQTSSTASMHESPNFAELRSGDECHRDVRDAQSFACDFLRRNGMARSKPAKTESANSVAAIEV